MTTYIHYIRLLKSGAVINDYNYNPMLERLALMRHVKCFTVLPNIGKVYREYSYEPPIVTVQETLTVADVPPSPFAVLPDTPVFARIRLADKVRYKDGKRVVSEQWSGKAYPVIGHRNGFELLDTGYGVIGRKISDCRYEPYGIAGAILPVQETKAA